MKLIVTVVQAADADGLTLALLDRGFPVTRVNSAGGFFA